MRVLGIETSCDETAAAIVEDGIKILSNVVASSQDMHAKTGGIIPENAAREQVKSIIPVINESLAQAKATKDDIDAIAVTIGPGLIGSLLVGVETAKTLGLLWDKPIIPVNHLIGHIYANWLGKEKKDLPQFPLLALVVSGGHTDLVLMKNHDSLEWIGGTRDDAAGEAFDKCARLLDLGYPGGPAISKAAMPYQDQNLNYFPRPMIDEKNFDWSFSGLKTAVMREVKDTKFSREQLAAQVQEAIVDVLIDKSIMAIEKFKPKSFLLGGGVAANNRLKSKFQDKLSSKSLGVNLHVPPIILCTDNAAVIASVAFYHNNPMGWQKITANPQLTITNDIIA